jgi:hypothetical protein
MPEEEDMPKQSLNEELTADAIVQDSSISPSETKTLDMEVHHHPDLHHRRKNFREYFLEFLMIFLAVTMGFIAENVREYITDGQKEKQYVLSLYEDLQVDTVKITYLINYDDEKINVLSHMNACYDTVSKNLKATSCMGALIKYSKTNRTFQLTDRTLRQLANAGGFRLLSKEDADSILVYESMFRQYDDFQKTIFQGAQDNVRSTLNLLADFKVNFPLQNPVTWWGKDTTHTDLSGPLLFSDDRVLLNRWFNELALYLRITKAQRNLLADLKDKATQLMAFYKYKHHLN